MDDLKLHLQPYQVLKNFFLSISWYTNKFLINYKYEILKFSINSALTFLAYYYFLYDFYIFNYLVSNGYNILYWTFLGILSSIGLGFGIHTGLLFLFPLIIRTSLERQSCIKELVGLNLDQCFIVNKSSNPNINIFLELLIPIFFWGAGTAIGEIPPYLISKLAKDKDIFDLNNSKYKIIQWLNRFTIRVLKKYGFWAIMGLASWPNASFDICGIAAGQYGITFYEFFGATLIGKAFIKAPMQCFLIINLFSGDNIQILISYLPNNLAYILTNFIDYQKNKMLHPSNNFSLVSFCWNTLIFGLFLYFIKSFIECIANDYLKKIKNS